MNINKTVNGATVAADELRLTMITIKKLKELIDTLPDDACATAYEGEGCGLIIEHGGNFGWIETGYGDDECEHHRHDLTEVIK